MTTQQLQEIINTPYPTYQLQLATDLLHQQQTQALNKHPKLPAPYTDEINNADMFNTTIGRLDCELATMDEHWQTNRVFQLGLDIHNVAHDYEEHLLNEDQTNPLKYCDNKVDVKPDDYLYLTLYGRNLANSLFMNLELHATYFIPNAIVNMRNTYLTKLRVIAEHRPMESHRYQAFIEKVQDSVDRPRWYKEPHLQHVVRCMGVVATHNSFCRGRFDDHLDCWSLNCFDGGLVAFEVGV